MKDLEKNIDFTHKFIAAQTVANEYYGYIKDYLIEQNELFLSTHYKNRFSLNRQERKKIEKKITEERKRFKATVERFEKITNSMIKSFDMHRNERNEKLIDDIYNLFDK